MAQLNDLVVTGSSRFINDVKSNKFSSCINNSVLIGTGTAAQDKGASANPRYFPAKWQFNTGYNPSEGDIITIALPVAGHGWGDWISINNGSTWHPANFQGATRLTTHFGAGQVVQFIFDADGSTASMTPVAGANSVNGSTITGGCWRVVNMYDSNTNNAVTQTGTPTSTGYNANYEILFSNTADDTTRTEGARKSSIFKFNPYNGAFMCGKNTVAKGEGCHAEGTYTTATTTDTTATQIGNHAEGDHTIAHATAGSAHAEGYKTTAYGTGSHAEGTSTSAQGHFSHAEGQQTTASGYHSHAEGYQTGATSSASHAEGTQTKATGAEGSHAEGNTTLACTPNSHAEGYHTTAGNSSLNGASCHAEGVYTSAIAPASHAEGRNTVVYFNGTYGVAAHAEGYYTTASNTASHASGHYNVDMTRGGNYNNTSGTAFVIGNGTAANALKNAFSVQFNGVVKAASTITASTTADYAEYFEWADENPNNEDRVGYFVTFDNGNKIRFATSEDDYILGVTSGEPFVLGNGDCDVWNGMVLRDEFRRIIYEPAPEMIDVAGGGHIPKMDKNGNPVYCGTRPKLNPNYDPSKPYVNRADRPEWCPVGMLGVLAVRDDGTCEVNGYATITDNAIATKYTGQNQNKYRVIHRNTQNVVEIVFR